ncbi:hypothetical protein P691DRAFT_788086 [Macrolepiota fuliginosa MF-IS2]|uniref:Uncharacterized protein n=1 Tax=Macrolepiota fuliginosa MF-IS2 TaxID=1400762 RepID=A0A9P5XKR7_9AGAR|nr:hypothetical protein P691DRAFT_788086 [Macrolepiota fuliginosa MF-IS2]
MSHHARVVIYNALSSLAVLLFLCTLLPAIFSRNVQRTMGWYGLMAAWLVYSDRQEGPPWGLCVVQVLFIHPGVVFLMSGDLRPQSAARIFWRDQFVFAGGGLSLVEFPRNGFGCRVNSLAQGVLTAVVTACTVLVLVPLEAWTGFAMYRHWTSFKRLGQNDRHLFLTVYIRFLLVTMSALIALVVALRAFAVPNDMGNIGIAYPFTHGAFISSDWHCTCVRHSKGFPSLQDILQVWVFWRPSEPYNTLVFHNRSSAADVAISIDLNTTTLLSRVEEEQPESQCPTIISPDSPTMPMDIHTSTSETKTTKEHIELTATGIRVAVNV